MCVLLLIGKIMSLELLFLTGKSSFNFVCVVLLIDKKSGFEIPFADDGAVM